MADLPEIIKRIDEIFYTIGSRIRGRDELDKLKAELKPASEIQGASSCNRSGYCCWRSPPVLSRGDLERAAKAVDKSEKEFFMSLCVVDYDGPVDKRCLRVKLRRAHQGAWAGRCLPAAEANAVRSPCVFLAPRAGDRPASCGLHGPGKPHECAAFKCWDNAAADAMSREEYEALQPAWGCEELAALGWDGRLC